MDYKKYNDLLGKDFLISFFKDNHITDDEIALYDAWGGFDVGKLTNDNYGINYAKRRDKAIIEYRDVTLDDLRKDYTIAPWAWKTSREFVRVPYVKKEEIYPLSHSILYCSYNNKIYFFNIGKEESSEPELDDMIKNGTWYVYTWAL